MAEITEVRVGGEQGDRARRGKFGWYGLVLLIAIAVVVAVAGMIYPAPRKVMATHFSTLQFRVMATSWRTILPRSEESAHAVSHVGDHSQMMRMGHLMLTEWDVTALNASLNDELKHGESVLEIHNDGQTVHRLAIWHGGVVQGDQVVGGALITETDYIRPGEFTILDVDLEPGEYVLVCSIRGHTARGMHAPVQVQ